MNDMGCVCVQTSGYSDLLFECEGCGSRMLLGQLMRMCSNGM